MKTRLFVIPIVSILVSALLLTGCGWLVTKSDAGALTTRQFDFTDFNTVQVGSSFKVDITPSDKYSIEITSNESSFKYINVTRKGNVLQIGLEGLHFFIGSRTLEAKITMPELAGVNVSGATMASVTGFKSTNDLDARVSGSSTLALDMEMGRLTGEVSGASHLSGNIKSTSADVGLSGSSNWVLDMETGDFDCQSSGASSTSGTLTAHSTAIKLTGASDIKLTGSGGNLDLSASDASDARLKGFSVGDADVGLSGGSHADLDVDGELSVSLSGASELIYGGNPILGGRTDISGGSRMEHR
jgi:hypothetical protein